MRAVAVQDVGTWQGRTVVDSRGDRIGRVVGVFAGERGEPEWAVVHTGLLGRRRNVVPLADVRTVGESLVQLPFTEEQVKEAPTVDAGEALSDEEIRMLHDHYRPSV